MQKIWRIRDEVLAAVAPVPAERVLLGDARGRVLAAPARAVRPAPPFTCSAMDGYAVRSGDGAGPLRVAATIYAGDVPPAPLGPEEAARIFTGGTLPAGADTVVREEAAAEQDGRVRFRDPPRQGENVRLAGEDVGAGRIALEIGTRLGPRQLALCVAVGAEEVLVHRRPRVTVLSTGDEIVRGLVPNSNGIAVATLLGNAGIDVERATIGDDLAALTGALSDALSRSDAVVTIGGVSVGAKDLVAAALERLAADLRVHGVPMKPGKPFLFALREGKPLLGLPGSPSACLVAFEVFVRPAVLRLAGARRVLRRALRLPLAEPVSGRAGRSRFLWSTLEADGRVRPVGRDAAQVRGPALADALIHLPEGRGEVPEGEPVEAMLLEEEAP